MTLAAGVLGLLLVASIVDHWIVDLGLLGRWALFALLLVFVSVFSVFRVVPVLLHRINPLYAARAIEEGTPSLKNSLINFLQLRDRREGVHQMVYRVVERQAASGLAGVPADVAVDRSRMIRMGCVLAAVLTIAACYKILSPKDPFQSVARIASPWTEMARPTRVEILDVQPGDVTVFHGQTVEITAVIRGGAEDRNVLFGTLDGQFVDRAVPLEADDRGAAFRATLPPSAEGVEQDLVYRVVAGDATSPEYTIRVSAAPTIRVERLEYEYPEYTRQEPTTVINTGDLEAIEGTRVTIRARANQPIRSAHLEMSRSGVDVPPRDLVRLPLEVEEDRAWRTIVLRMDEDRVRQQFESYHIQFVTQSGHANEDPIRHQVRVLADLPPEVEILTPTKTRIQVPVDRSQQIEVRGLDPDFGLARIDLELSAGEQRLPTPNLFQDPAGWLGQKVVRYSFVPSELGLAVGDRVEYWAVVEDNRQDSQGRAEPNRVRTRSYQIEVAPPRDVRFPGDEPAPTEDEREDSTGDDAEEGGEGSDSGAEGMSGGSSSEESGDGEGEQEQGAGTGGASEQQDNGDSGGSSDGEGAESGGASGQRPDSPSDPNQSQGGDSQGEGGQGEGSQGEGAADAEAAGASGQEASSDETGQAPTEELHDGEVFEKALEYLQDQQNQQSGGDAKSSPADTDGTTDQSDPAPADGTNDGGQDSPSEAGQSGERAAPSGNANDGNANDGNANDGSARDGQDDLEPGQAESQRDGQERANDQAGDAGTEPPSQESGGGNSRSQESGEGSSGQSDSGGEQRGTEGDESGSREPAQGAGTEQRDPSSAAGEQPSTSDGQSEASSTEASPASGSERGSESSDAGSQEPSESPEAGGASSGDDRAGPSGNSDAKPGERDGGTDGDSGERGSDNEQPREGGAADERAADSESTGSRSGGGTESAGGNPDSRGGGVPRDGTREPAGSFAETPEGDEANLEYARKATDLVLEALKDQQAKPKDELLDKLGWTPEELRAFVERWQKMKQAARDGGSEERRLNDTLRGLGLRPPTNRLRSGSSADRGEGGLRESGALSPPPASYRDQFDAFRRSRSRLGRP